MGVDFITQFYLPEPILDFLRSSIIPGFLDGILDFWLILHFISGIILFFSLKKAKHPIRDFWLWNIGNEIVELFLFSRNLAIPEVFLNQVADLLVTWMGYKLAEKKLNK